LSPLEEACKGCVRVVFQDNREPDNEVAGGHQPFTHLFRETAANEEIKTQDARRKTFREDADPAPQQSRGTGLTTVRIDAGGGSQ
jgi:hypothetical protein